MKKDPDVAAEILHKKLTVLGVPFTAIHTDVDGLVVDTDSPNAALANVPASCGGHKVWIRPKSAAP